jgi:carboxyl-terminal processing protease
VGASPDQPQQNKAELPGANPGDQQTPAFDPMILFQHYKHAKVDLTTPVELHGGNAATVKSCPASPDYDKYIDVAARFIYDPKALGNIADLEHKYDCDIHTTDDIFKYASQALTVTGDAYDYVMPPAEARDFEKAQTGGYAGIGLSIVPAAAVLGPMAAARGPGATVIQAVTPGKSAQKAGLEVGDALLEIDGLDVHALGPKDTSDLITNGRPGSKVDIVVDRKGQRVEKLVTREEIESAPVVHDKDLGDGIAYIKIDTFNNNKEAAQLAAAMDKYKNARAFVIDVRDNRGGLVDQALASAALFVKDGTLMTTRERHDSPPTKPVYDEKTYVLGKNTMITTATRSDTGEKVPKIENRQPYKAGERPVVVLTNGYSASASEIFSGALHDTAHDTVIGTTSLGKGIGQVLVKNMPDDGYLKVTNLRYLTPAGNWPGPGTGDKTHPEYGLKPDKEIADPAESDKGTAADGQLNYSVDFLKHKLQGK